MMKLHTNQQAHTRTNRFIVAFATALALIAGLSISTGTAFAQSRETLASGATIACVQPPQNMDLATFTPTELDTYGLPRRPADAAKITTWREVLQHAKHRVCTSTPTNKVTMTLDSFNWAGNVATGGGYDEIDSKWNVPCLQSSVANTDSAAWVGLGGTTNNAGDNLVQTGTEQDVTGSGSKDYYAWYEVFPAQSQQRVYNVHCGDLMYAEADSNSIAYPNESYMIIEDITQNIYSPHPSSVLSNQSTAEWIIERPQVGGVFTNLADFGTITFVGAETDKSHTELSVGQTTHDADVMYDGKTLAYPDYITNNGYNFPVHWQNYS